MSTPKRRIVQPDPAIQHNQAILADRAEREAERLAQQEAPVDLGLKLEHQAPRNAMEFLRDEFDKRTFGDAPPTYTRTLYGPDPLLLSCPGMKDKIEQIGLEDYAECTAEAIKTKQHRAFDDALLQKGIRQAIKQFGVDQVADAFKKRILAIPTRVVEIEADRGDDDEIFGKPLEDAVRRYGNPGMAPKFLSPRCIDALGYRGYRIVIDEHGDPVKVGTLIMGEIPIAVAERRRMAAAKTSQETVNEQEEMYMDAQARFLKSTGNVGMGSRPLQPGEVVEGFASESQSLLGERLDMGVKIESQS